ncbi:hypothetical protein VP01_3117g3 [Puccinia sorghi]|uniref:Velvet domain-containing protein n=1 Tax=Puccinia sorghi TaxID=27349 RepID=A0A0L6UZ99_9BASI|nr:hypothetical protein VP01_3117g3 [Puccinia sorghi]
MPSDLQYLGSSSSLAISRWTLQLRTTIRRRVDQEVARQDIINFKFCNSPFEAECVVLVTRSDRRLLTPPVIVELLMFDSHTGRQINTDQMDTSFFVLNADLWNSRATHELNIVMHPVFYNPESANYASARDGQAPGLGVPGPSTRAPATSSTSHFCGTSAGAIPSFSARTAFDSPARPTGEMAYTRNLIGALAQSGSKLKGLDGQPGVFFIFHDLSCVPNIVRTEGIFCLQFTLVLLGKFLNPQIIQNPISIARTNQQTSWHPRSASHSKYIPLRNCNPGMLGKFKPTPYIRPTTLTRHFSAQRVRIPTTNVILRGDAKPKEKGRRVPMKAQMMTRLESCCLLVFDARFFRVDSTSRPCIEVVMLDGDHSLARPIFHHCLMMSNCQSKRKGVLPDVTLDPKITNLEDTELSKYIRQDALRKFSVEPKELQINSVTSLYL